MRVLFHVMLLQSTYLMSKDMDMYIKTQSTFRCELNWWVVMLEVNSFHS